MRKLIFAVAGLFSLIGTSAHSSTLEGVAKNCHTWSTVNFGSDLNSLTSLDQFKVGVCIGYMSAFRDAGATNCLIQKQKSDHNFAAFHFHENYSIQQLAQLTLNYKRDNPDKWGWIPALVAADIATNGKCDKP
ncbi:hypothetical protein AB8879_09970 [Alphaproteobacteria bacterium LSUCC0744]